MTKEQAELNRIMCQIAYCIIANSTQEEGEEDD